MLKKQKFIRREWARLRAIFDRLPQSWFLIGGTLLFIIAFGVTSYEAFLSIIFGQ